MIKYLEKTGKTEDEAVAAALEELGVERDDVSVEIIERAKAGFLGIGAVPAKIRVSWESDEPDAEELPAAEAEAEQEAAEIAVPAAQPEKAEAKMAAPAD